MRRMPLKEFIHRWGLTYQELADLADLTETTIVNGCAGQSLSGTSRTKIAEALSRHIASVEGTELVTPADVTDMIELAKSEETKA